MYLLDPISLITRTLVISFYPPFIYVFNHLLPAIQRFLPKTLLSCRPFRCRSSK
jgi:hypothetical protein